MQKWQVHANVCAHVPMCKCGCWGASARAPHASSFICTHQLILVSPKQRDSKSEKNVHSRVVFISMRLYFCSTPLCNGVFVCAAALFFIIPLPFHYLKMNESFSALWIRIRIRILLLLLLAFFFFILIFHKIRWTTIVIGGFVSSVSISRISIHPIIYLHLEYCDDAHHLHNV